MKVRLESVGCRLNIAEIEAMGRRLIETGHRLVASDEVADLCILNSCTVTATASATSRQLIRQLRRANPGAALVATGCYAELEPDAARALGVDLVVGNLDKGRLLDILVNSGLLDQGVAPSGQPPRPPGTRRTRAFLKVQDGCDLCCAYCVVTIARGPARSRPLDQVVDEIDRLCELGYREVVLTGVHLGSYGCDLGDRHGLQRLVEAVLARTGVPRLRLSSLEPWDVEPALCDLFAERRLLPHLHLPLQSGCEATLRRMRRRTTQAEYRELVAVARGRIPRVSISTDVMVGFPGETDAEFAESIAFVASLAFSRLHVFRFSPRPGTPAATLSDRVPDAMVQQRSRRMIALGHQLETAFNRSFVGCAARVLWEASQSTVRGRLRWSGLTESYVRAFVDTAADADLANQITDVEVTDEVAGGVEVRLTCDP